jgi:3-hydroxy-9,10-secoandrosta-1,3,5(10)-triene-9,17-dione monooxygenase
MAATAASTGPELTHEEAVARAREVAAKVATRRDETDALRHVPDATIEDFRSSGLLKINQAARWGGVELGLETVVDVVSEVARGDGSSGWVCGLLMSHAWLISIFGEEVQQEVWGDDPDTLISSSFVQIAGTCEQVEGGYRINGRWPFSSGSDHCRWAMLGILIPPVEEGLPPLVRWALVPRGDYKVDDDWRTISLRGTGSHSLVVDDAFVPEHRAIDAIDAVNGQGPGAAMHGSPIFHLPFAVALGWYLASPAVGIALQAHEDWVGYVSKKRHVFSGENVGAQTPTLVRLGATSARIAAARTLMTSTTREIDDVLAGGARVDGDLRGRSGRDATFVVRECIDAVEQLMQYSGGNGLFETHPVQRAWRDVHGVGAHVGFNPDTTYQAFGRAALGLPPAPGMF